MNTTEEMVFFEKKLAELEANGKGFNLRAFVFSSFYFWKMKMSGAFVFFVFLPIFLMFFMMFFFNPLVAFGVGFLLAHLIAGVVADSLMEKTLKGYIAVRRDIIDGAQVAYFAISVVRLVVCFILTGGFYAIYWGFKNWSNYQKATKEPLNPYINAWFFVFTAGGLFARMAKTLGECLNYKLYGIVYMLSFLAFVFSVRYLDGGAVSPEGADVLWGIALVGFIFSLMCLVKVQRMVNDYTAAELKQPLYKSFSWGEVLMIILGMINTFYPYPVGGTPSLKLSDVQVKQVASHSVLIYRHTKGYAAVCQKEGYELKKYPNEFEKRFTAEIARFDTKLARYGMSLAELEQEFITDDLKQAVENSIYDDLESWREEYVRGAIAGEEGIAYDDVPWDESMRGLVSLAQVCEVFDNYAMKAYDATFATYHFEVDGL